MQNHYKANVFQKVIVPITPNCHYSMLLNAARLIAGNGQVIIKGLVGVLPNESLSTGTLLVRQVRKNTNDLTDGKKIIAHDRVVVSHDPWDEFVDTIDEERPDLLVMEWPIQLDDMNILPEEALFRPPCDVALVKGPIPAKPKNLLVALRGSPYAEFGLRVALALSRTSQAKITSIHVTPPGSGKRAETPFPGLAKVLANMPEVEQKIFPAKDTTQALVEQSCQYDLIVLGATTQQQYRTSPIGPIAERILKESSSGTIVVKSTRPVSFEGDIIGESAISILVDKWFAENTYHADEFIDLNNLLDLKTKQNLTISLALPALNEEETVGNVIQTVRHGLMDEVSLLDEIVLMDSNSTDRTREIAQNLGVPVYIHQDVLTKYGARDGKGEALWKSLYVTKGDIIVWVDTDIVNIHPRFVYGLLGPLLVNPAIQFIKGFYRRPLKIGEKVQAGGGGRVTELTARPLLNLFFPELSGIIQPLSGEYGGRRAALEKLDFYSGYGVEIGLLIDMLEKFGLGAIAQVDLRERIHHNQPLESLSKMSFAIIQVVIRKLEKRYGQDFMEEVNKSMKLIRYEPGRLFLEVEKIAERDRPPMVEIPEYMQQHS